MCGRFALTTDPARLAVRIGARDETRGEVRAPNYNIAPTADIAVLVAGRQEDDPADRPTLRLRPMRWGLVPPWGPGGAAQLINARAETAATAPAFRAAARNRRCLIPMDGYYEWKPNPHTSRGTPKTPFYFFRPDGEPLLMAGLWSVWQPDQPDHPVVSCAVITTEAVGEFAAVHNRMPLRLRRIDWDRWLDPDVPAPGDLLGGSADLTGMAMRQVSTLVNSTAHNGPELIDPVDPGNQPVGLF